MSFLENDTQHMHIKHTQKCYSKYFGIYFTLVFDIMNKRKKKNDTRVKESPIVTSNNKKSLNTYKICTYRELFFCDMQRC